MRTGGAQALAGLGVDPIRIQTMGRWKSDLVIRYSGSRGSSGITRDAARGLVESGYLAAKDTSIPVPDIAVDTLAVLDSQTRDLETNKQNYQLSHAMPTTYILNGSSGVMHKCTFNNTKTLCGLQYVGWAHELYSALPSREEFVSYCARCCRYDKNQFRAVEDSSDDNSE